MRLLVDGVEVAHVQVAETSWQKMKGLLGKTSIDGALYFPDIPSVHTLFMRFTIDVAFLDKNNVVVFAKTMRPWRISGKHNKVRHVLEAQAGSFAEWNLRTGSRIAIEQ